MEGDGDGNVLMSGQWEVEEGGKGGRGGGVGSAWFLSVSSYKLVKAKKKCINGISYLESQ